MLKKLFQSRVSALRYTSVCYCIPNQPPAQRHIITRCLSQQSGIANPSDDNVGYQVGSFVGNLKHNLAKYMARGLTAKNLYEQCADGVSYEEFFRACKMPDTFQSWFYVMQLHMWMLLVRLRVEGRYGKNISHKMVEIMWQDVEQRVKLIGVEDSSERRESMEEFAQQFFGLIIAYDEGLLGHDRVLASALWRNLFYNKHDTDAESLSALVGYVRKQVQYLETQNSNDILLQGKVRWLPLYESEIDQEKSDTPDPG